MKTVRELFETNHTKGEVGLEIEMEGTNLHIDEDLGFWRGEADGSLRGDESIEYVLRKPVPRNQVAKALDELYVALREQEATIDMTHRTSVHVHINVQQLEVNEVYNFICLYLIFEDMIMDAMCSESRKGNLFCLRASDAEYLYEHIERAIEHKDLRWLNEGDVRYSALNLLALHKFGSLEFRALQGTDDPDLIKRWVGTLLKMKDKAKTFKSPKEIIEGFSMRGTEEFTKFIFGDDVPFKGELMESVWRVQNLAYTYDRVYNPPPELRWEDDEEDDEEGEEEDDWGDEEDEEEPPQPNEDRQREIDDIMARAVRQMERDRVRRIEGQRVFAVPQIDEDE